MVRRVTDAMIDFILDEENYMPEPNSGCWIWMGILNPDGYSIRGSLRPHRVIYESFKGKIPDGLVIDHLCRVRCCVNPDHLEPVTNKENILRGVGPTAKNSKKTHCSKGHLFTEKNTRIRFREGAERRSCKLCQAQHLRDFRERRK